MTTDNERLAILLSRQIQVDDRDEIYRRIDELTGQTLSHEALDDMTEIVMHERNAYLQGWKR